jgi:hypothetical protein
VLDISRVLFFFPLQQFFNILIFFEHHLFIFDQFGILFNLLNILFMEVTDIRFPLHHEFPHRIQLVQLLFVTGLLWPQLLYECRQFQYFRLEVFDLFLGLGFLVQLLAYAEERIVYRTILAVILTHSDEGFLVVETRTAQEMIGSWTVRRVNGVRARGEQHIDFSRRHIGYHIFLGIQIPLPLLQLSTRTLLSVEFRLGFVQLCLSNRIALIKGTGVGIIHRELIEPYLITELI